MNRYECISCISCGGKCDQCCLICCIDNMEKHREIFRLKDEFDNKVKSAEKNLIDICYEIQNNLFINYGIIIEISSILDRISQSKDFLNKIENKRNELQKDLDNINEEKLKVKNENLNEINNLVSIHERKMNEINQNYEEIMKKFEINESKYEKEISEKKEKKQDLINEKKEINIDIDGIIRSFVEEEKLKAEKELELNKQQIDKNNIIKEEILTQPIYTENELQMKNKYLNEIKKLNDYSNKIPNFNNWIILYGLNNYIN